MVHTPEHQRGTIKDFRVPEGFKDTPVKTDPKARCEAKGGIWDAKNNVCIMPHKPEGTEVPEVPEVKVKQGLETFRDVETGELSGVTLPNGKTFLGLTPEEVREFARTEAERVAQPTGTQPAGTARRQAEEQARLQQLIGQVGQIGALTAAQEADINFSQAAAAGLAGIIPAAAGGAAIGAAAGLVGTGGVLSLPGAVAVGGAGAIGGFVSGLLGNIKEQQRGELGAAKTELTDAKTNMRQLAMLASRDPANADIYISQYNQILTRVYQARRQTRAETRGDLNAWMEDGREDLALFDSFLRSGGIADIYGQKLSVSLATGVPLSINGEDLFLDEG